MALRRRSLGDDLPAFGPPDLVRACAGGRCDRTPRPRCRRVGGAAHRARGLRVFVLAGGPHPDAEAAVAPAPRSEPATHAAPGRGVVDAPPASSLAQSHAARSRSSGAVEQPALSRGWSGPELHAGRAGARALFRVDAGEPDDRSPRMVAGEKSAVTNRVRIFDAADGESLVQFAVRRGSRRALSRSERQRTTALSALAFPWRRAVVPHVAPPVLSTRCSACGRP